MIVDKYYIWGAGTYGKRFINFMNNDCKIEAIIDNNPLKQNTSIYGLPVISYEQAKKSLPSVKIIITQVYPNTIRNFLLNEQYKEYIDFMSIYDFIPRFFWEQKKQLIPKVANITPANFCNLKCKYCQTYMPYNKNPKITPYNELVNDINLFFNHIDKVFLINIVCGESFLNKQLSKFVKYVYEAYFGRYGTLAILTNGTIIPTDNEMRELSETDVVISISDYTEENLELKIQQEKLVNKCEQYKVAYYLNTSSNKEHWFDFGNPYNIIETNTEKLKQRYNRCFKCGNGIKDGKLYICQTHNAALSVLGISIPADGDYFDLSQEKTEQSILELLKVITRVPDRGYVEHCKHCNGTITIREMSNDA